MIRTKQYGTDGPTVSRLGFGVMRLPQKPGGGWGDVDFSRAVPLLREALEKGVTFFDSHHNYHGGKSESAIGKALKDWKGGPVVIQTKTPWYREEPREFFEKLLYEALEKLGVNSIDYLLHHSMRMDVWEKRGREFIAFTDWAINRGLIKRRGFSSHETPENIREFIDTGEFSAMLVSYNWMNPAVRDVIAYAAGKGMGVSVMNPVGGGVLATDTPQVRRLVRGAHTAAEIALRYVLATPGVTCALSGMNTPEQLTENVRVACRPTMLTAKQSAGMADRLGKLRQEARTFCTGCGYCMPCPEGVDIPKNFSLLNRARLFGHTEWARQQYAKLKNHDDGDRSAEACVRCGQCEPKCPNDVPIRRHMVRVRDMLGSDG